MKPVFQDKFYRAETGEDGNCFQAAVASLLGLELEQVPNFMDDKPRFEERYIRFVAERGFSIICLDFETARNLDAYYLALGRSDRAVGHVVVYRKGQLAHDPHPANTGLQAVDFVHVFVPRSLSGNFDS